MTTHVPNFAPKSDQRDLRNSAAIAPVAKPEPAKLDPGRCAPPDPLLRDKEAAALLEISIATFWRRVKDGTVPPPIKIGSMSRWPRSEILAVIDRAKAARDAVA